jgi:lysozyme family protein
VGEGVSDDAILAGILRREGGYVDDPADRGRCTNMGITIGALRDWRGKPVTCDDVRKLTEAEAKDIYRARYLRPFDGIEQAIKPQVVDIAVNAGVTRARALLALAHQSSKPLGTALTIERLKHYASIVAADPSQSKFLKGWINRAVEFL